VSSAAADAPQPASPRASLHLEPAPAGECRRPDVTLADAPRRPEARRLGELPDGDLLLGVYREVDGCMEPVIVRFGEGRGPAAEARPEARMPAPRVWR
jgi:hypothetical protein